MRAGLNLDGSYSAKIGPYSSGCWRTPLSCSGGMSVSIWMKFTVASSGNWDGIISTHRRETETNGFSIIKYNGNGKDIGFTVRDPGRQKFIKVEVSHPNVGTWDHYLFTMLPNGGVPDFTAYINGQPISLAAPGESNKNTNAQICDEIVIGRYFFETTGYQINDVIIDELSIFEFILSSTQVAAIYQGAL